MNKEDVHGPPPKGFHEWMKEVLDLIAKKHFQLLEVMPDVELYDTEICFEHDGPKFWVMEYWPTGEVRCRTSGWLN